MLEALLGFIVGGGAGFGAAWVLLSRRRSTPATAPPPAAQAALEPEPEPLRPRASEVSELATASRQLLSELETRYQGRTVTEGEAKAPRRRAAKAPRPKRS